MALCFFDKFVRFVLIATATMFATPPASSASDPTPKLISSYGYRSLEPYCGKPAVAERFLALDQEFQVGASWRLVKQDLLTPAEKGPKKLTPDDFSLTIQTIEKEIATSATRYAAIRKEALAGLAAMSPEDSLLRATAHDVLILAWRLSASERHRLLVDAMAAHPAVETEVVEAIQRCIAEEAQEVIAAMPEGQDKETYKTVLSTADVEVPTRESIQTRLAGGSRSIWTPDPVLRAFDAAELVAAWLDCPTERTSMPTYQRCYRLLTMSAACVTPNAVPGRSAIHRVFGRPALVATTAIFPNINSRLNRLADQTEPIRFALQTTHTNYSQNTAIKNVLNRLTTLEAIVDQHGRQIAELQAGLAAVNARVDAVEVRLTTVENEVEALKARVQAIEDFLSNKLSPKQTSTLLQKFAPILKHHDWTSGPLMRPSDFAKHCEFLVVNGGRNDLRGRHFEAKGLRDFLSDDTTSNASRGWEMIPHDVRQQKLGMPTAPAPIFLWGNQDETRKRLNEEAINAGHGVFGAVRCLGATTDEDQANFGDAGRPSGEQPYTWSVKYFWFNAYNKTEFFDDEGDHEGDWGCVDITVRMPFKPNVGADVAKAEAIDAIIHEHGRPHRYHWADLNKRDGRLVVYLETGTNEAHPQPGGRAELKKIPYTWIELGHVIRAHRGTGFEYDLQRHPVKNLFDKAFESTAPEDFDKVIDVQLVRRYHGQWGEFDNDDYKWAWGDATNPPGPLDNAKFRDRKDVIDHRHKH